MSIHERFAPSNVGNLCDLERLLRLLAESGASSWELHPLEMPDVVDPIQYFAEKTGLVDLIGPDAVQEIIAAPFARIRRSLEAPR